MALEIKWSPRAASNLEEICDYIAKDSEYYAILFVKKVTAIVKAIPQFPKSGRMVPEILQIGPLQVTCDNTSVFQSHKNAGDFAQF